MCNGIENAVNKHLKVKEKRQVMEISSFQEVKQRITVHIYIQREQNKTHGKSTTKL